MSQSASTSDSFRAKRWADFRRRADMAPASVYQHRTHGWEYIPVHPFADEPKELARLGLRPEDCWGVDAWWGIDGDAPLLEARIVGVGSAGAARLFAKPTDHGERWVYLVAVLDAPFVTRTAFEAAMVLFAEAGFPRDPAVPVALGRCAGADFGRPNMSNAWYIEKYNLLVDPSSGEEYGSGDPESMDVAYLTAAAVSGDWPYKKGPGVEARRKFWHWYLRRAVPKAWASVL
jgi:hypothetical protein